MMRWIAICGVPALALCLTIDRASAQDPKSVPIVTPLVTRELPDLANKEVRLLTVEYLPGGASLPHRHDAHVFVYVLEGTLRMQVDGGEPVTLGPGETFYEDPQAVHRVSANASDTEPAKLLVFIVKDRDKPVSRPVS